MIAERRNWLTSIPWENVVQQNRALCEQGNVPHELNPERHDYVRKLWETTAARPLKFNEVLEALKQCIQEKPFRYNNLNCFSEVARNLVRTHMPELPAVEETILSNTVCRYVEGKTAKPELLRVLKYFAHVNVSNTPVEAPQASPANVQAQPQTS